MSLAHAAPDVGRDYPPRPIVGVAGVVFRNGKVLLIQRGHDPGKGAWSLPGGALHLGEQIVDGIAREVQEETGVLVRPLELVEVLDRISHDPSGRVQFHYVVLDWLCAAEPGSGEVVLAGSDAADALWADLTRLESYTPDPVTLRVIRRAALRAQELGL